MGLALGTVLLGNTATVQHSFIQLEPSLPAGFEDRPASRGCCSGIGHFGASGASSLKVRELHLAHNYRSYTESRARS